MMETRLTNEEHAVLLMERRLGADREGRFKARRWRLFLDDERVPSAALQSKARADRETLFVYRNVDEAIWRTILWGLPSEIYFDHDLGAGTPDAIEYAHAFGHLIIEHGFELPDPFHYEVHSQNPIGKGNIEGYMDNLLKAKANGWI